MQSQTASIQQAKAQSGAEVAKHGLDQQVADESSIKDQSLEEIAQPSRDQDVKIKDCVERVQRVLESQTVRLRDDAMWATKARIARQSDPQPHDDDHVLWMESKLWPGMQSHTQADHLSRTRRLVSPANHAQHVSEHAVHKRTVRHERERRAGRDGQTSTTRSPQQPQQAPEWRRTEKSGPTAGEKNRKEGTHSG